MDNIDKDLAALLAEMKAYGEANHVPIINERGLQVLIEAVRSHQAHRVLEIGTAIGYSALYIAAHSAPDVEITTLELSPERAAEARGFVDRSPYREKINILVGDAGESLLQLGNMLGTAAPETAAAPARQSEILQMNTDGLSEEITVKLEGKFDLVFIDAAKGQYPDYFRKIYPMLTDDAMVIADNVLFRGYVQGGVEVPRRFKTIVKRLREYIGMVTDNAEFATEIFAKGDGLAVSRRVSRA